MFVFVLFASSCVSLVAVRKKMGYGLVKPRVVRSCVVYVRKTSNFGPCIRNLTGQSIRGASSKKMAYETCSSQNVQAHPEV